MRGVVVAVVIAAMSAEARADDPFAPCDARVAAEPTSTRMPACYYQVAVKVGQLEEGARRLEALLAARPGDAGVLLALGNCESDLDRSSAEARYRAAIAGFEQAKDAQGAVFASLNLSTYLLRRDRIAEARPVLEAASYTAAAAGDRGLRNAVRIEHARVLVQGGGNLGKAHRILLDAEADLFPDGDPMAQRRCLYGLGMLAVYRARPAEAMGYFRRLLDSARAAGDRMMTATALNRLASTMEQALAGEPRDGRADQLLATAREAVAAALASGNAYAEARSRLIIANLAHPAAAAVHLARCHVIAAQLEQPGLAGTCRQAEAWVLVQRGGGDASRAFALVEHTIAAARERGDVVGAAIALQDRAILRWHVGPRAQAVQASREAAEAIEAVRDRQRDLEARTDLLVATSGFWERVAGQLLMSGTPDDVAAGFAWMEQRRARSLLEALDGAGGALALSGGRSEPARRRDAALERIAKIQLTLLDPALAADQRAAQLDGLAAAERDEAAALDDLKAADPRFAVLHRPAPVALAAVAQQLAPDQAMITFQLAPTEDLWGFARGGSWAVVISHAGVTVVPLGDGRRFEVAVEGYRGLVERRDGSDAAAAAALYDMALRPALAALPPDVRRLVLVPDGVLHAVPWGALRASPAAPPLVTTFELTIAPSATVWERLRREPGSAGRAALVFADPTPPASAGGPPPTADGPPPTGAPPSGAGAPPLPAGERAWTLASGARLGRLPHARGEGRAVAARVAGARVLLDDEASEAALGRADLAPYGLLHFATHAIADDAFPERSAVLLAPGDAIEDGLLQLREILGLDLRGRVVVLSACRSAAGSVTPGDGVRSLTRGFLAAGAPAVIGSLWPLRDDEAAALFDAFYRHLAGGATLEAALAAAQRERAAAGAPAAAWAGVVLHGDGGRAPVVPRPPADGRGAWWRWALVAAGALAIFLSWWVRSSAPRVRPG